jgi:prepilin-type N-terminal cleavage/methylation domain-containing protein
MKSSRGFTLIELLVVIAIIGILASVVIAAMNSTRGKSRFASVLSQMREIQNIAELTGQGAYAPDVAPDILPATFNPPLVNWPKPPCSGWVYDWENWSSGNQIYISLRNASSTIVAYWCITDSVENCANTLSSGAKNIRTNWASKSITCSE